MQNQADGEKEDMFSVDRYKAASDNKNAMDILKRLEEEKKEEERKKQQEIEEERRKAQEQERIDSIMNKNKVNVNEFIEEGMNGRSSTNTMHSDGKDIITGGDEEKKQEELRKAQEIIDRLNREAAEDEAIKAAEIEKAREKAKEQFGK